RSASDIFAVGDQGVIVHFDGSTWTQQASPTKEKLRRIWAENEDIAYAVGDKGTIISYDGSDWTEVPFTAPEEDLLAVWGVDGYVFVAERSGQIYLNEGSSWLRFDEIDVNGGDIQGIWGLGASGVLAVGFETNLLDDNIAAIWQFTGFTMIRPAVTTTPAPAEPLRAVFQVADNNLIAVGDSGLVMSSTGGDWSQVPLPGLDLTADLRGVWGSGPDNIIAVGTGRVIVSYDGSEWTARLPPIGNAVLNAVSGRSSSEVYVVGNRGIILRYDGTSWTQMASPTTEDLNGVTVAPDSGSATGLVYAVGDSGVVLSYDGTTWTEIETPTDALLRGVWASATGQVFAVGVRGTILRYDGSNWLQDSAPSDELLTAVWGTSGEDVFAVGEDLLHYDGINWQPYDGDDTEDFLGVTGSPRRVVLVGGQASEGTLTLRHLYRL
ncbi:MAG: hypothetical protein AAGC55_07125, partial [Myxococcota bacterium]